MTLPPAPTPIDILLPLLWLFIVVVSAQRGLVGLIAGLAGAVFLKPLLLLADTSAPLALVVALLLGLLLVLLVRPFPGLSYRQPRWGYPLGALGGAVLGTVLILTLLVSLPLGRDLNGAVQYPAEAMPFSSLFERSRLVAFGRAILLYPLLERRGEISPQNRDVLSALHTMFVVGQPWKEAEGQLSRKRKP